MHVNDLAIPAARTSTVIFVAGGSPPSGEARTTFLAFAGNSLALPAGLSVVDDLDTKPDGWGN